MSTPLTVRTTAVLTPEGPKVRLDFSQAIEYLEQTPDEARAQIAAMQAALDTIDAKPKT